MIAIRHSSGCETLISISLFMPDVSFLYAGVMPRPTACERPRRGRSKLADRDRRQMLAYRAARPVNVLAIAIRATGARSGAKASKKNADRSARGGLCAAWK